MRSEPESKFAQTSRGKLRFCVGEKFRFNATDVATDYRTDRRSFLFQSGDEFYKDHTIFLIGHQVINASLRLAGPSHSLHAAPFPRHSLHAAPR